MNQREIVLDSANSALVHQISGYRAGIGPASGDRTDALDLAQSIKVAIICEKYSWLLQKRRHAIATCPRRGPVGTSSSMQRGAIELAWALCSTSIGGVAES
jgi:hypothetical protein